MGGESAASKAWAMTYQFYFDGEQVWAKSHHYTSWGVVVYSDIYLFLFVIYTQHRTYSAAFKCPKTCMWTVFN